MSRYAVIERERRFLLAQLPVDLNQAQFTLIEDVYVNNTRLRLRKMTAPDGAVLDLKFGHKFVAADQPAHHTTMTNFYLNEAEFALLSTLSGRRLVKKRFRYPWHGRIFSIDQFQHELDGLILAEIEALTDEDLTAVLVPEFALREVTDDLFFTGGELVGLMAGQLQARLQLEFGN